MEDFKCNEIIENMSLAFAYNKVIYDKDNNPKDFIVLKTNKKFEEVTGFNKDNVIQKQGANILDGIVNNLDEVIQFCGEVALNAKSKSFVEYAENKGFLTIRSYIYKDDYLDRVSVFQSKFEGELIVPITKRTMKTAEISYKYNDDGLLEKETMRNYRNGKKESRKYKYNIETSN